jgi:endonuclease YncB( thermonuclease family)
VPSHALDLHTPLIVCLEMKPANRAAKFYQSLVLIIILFLFASPAASLTVVRVYDGDTIHLKNPDSKTQITNRLAGIDAPETSKSKHQPGQPFSEAAAKHLAALVLNKTVTLQEYGHDRYGLTLAVVYVNGTNVNLEIKGTGK